MNKEYDLGPCSLSSSFARIFDEGYCDSSHIVFGFQFEAPERGEMEDLVEKQALMDGRFRCAILEPTIFHRHPPTSITERDDSNMESS